MPAWLKKVQGYLAAALVGAAGLLGLIAAIFLKKKDPKKEGADAPQGKAEILAGDPRDSLNRLPADERTRLDASTKSDIDAQVDGIFKRRNG